MARPSLLVFNGKNCRDFNQFADLLIRVQGCTELSGRQQQSRAWSAEPVFVDGDHRHAELWPPECADVLRLSGAARDHNGLRMAHQHLLTADLRPADAALCKDVAAANLSSTTAAPAGDISVRHTDETVAGVPALCLMMSTTSARAVSSLC